MLIFRRIIVSIWFNLIASIPPQNLPGLEAREQRIGGLQRFLRRGRCRIRRRERCNCAFRSLHVARENRGEVVRHSRNGRKRSRGRRRRGWDRWREIPRTIRAFSNEVSEARSDVSGRFREVVLIDLYCDELMDFIDHLDTRFWIQTLDGSFSAVSKQIFEEMKIK